MPEKSRKKVAKKLLQRVSGNFEAIDLKSQPYTPSWMTRAFKNNHYIVMIDDNCQMTKGITAIRAIIQRVDDKPIPGHWRKMQDIKNEIFGRNTAAIEYYPAESDLIDDKNIYWLWILPADALPLAIHQ